MGLFGKKRTALVPPEVLAHLTEYGQREFEGTQDQNFAPTMAMTKLQMDQGVRENPEAATSEICRAASAQGGWALYGAWTVIHAFLPDGTTRAEYQQTMDESLRFLRGLGMPPAVLSGRMRSDVRTRWRELFPEDGL